MANLQIANKWNLFSYGFAEENQEICQKLKELYRKPFRFWQKTQGFEKKLKGMRPYWAYWASIKCSKTKLALDSPYDFFVYGFFQIIGLLDVFTPSTSLDTFTDLYLVTPLMGADLNIIVKTQRLSDDHVQFLIYQILRGMKYVHSAGIIHRVSFPF